MTTSRTVGGADQGGWGPGLLESIWRFLWLVLVLVVIGAVAGYWAVGRQPDRYRASARLHLSAQPRSGVFGEERTKMDPARRLLDQSERITSRPVLARAGELLGDPQVGSSLAGKVDTRVSTELDVIEVRVTDDDPERAAGIANAVVKAYEEHMLSTRAAATQSTIEKLGAYRARLEAAVGQADAQLNELQVQLGAAVTADNRYRDIKVRRTATFNQLTAVQNRIDQLSVDAAAAVSDVELVEEASPPRSPGGTDATRGALLGGALGLLLGAGVAWTFAERRQLVRTGHAADGILGVPCLGEVPDDKALRGLPTKTMPWSEAAEAFNFLVASLNPALAEPRTKTWLVTSPAPRDGKTTTALNLAVAAQKRGLRVVVVDADLRGRGLTLRSGAAEHYGLTDVAAGNVPFGHCAVKLDARANGASPLLLPTGGLPDDPAVFFGDAGFWTALRRIEEEVDLVLIDAASLLVVADARAIAERVTGTIVVVTPTVSNEALEATAQVLRWTSTPVLGYVVNRARRRRARIVGVSVARPGRRWEGRPRSSERRTPALVRSAG